MSRILIIEDEEAIADLEKDYLELSEFEVDIENAGDTGLARALAEDFDLIKDISALYSKVAIQHSSTSEQVETEIYKAIEIMYDRADIDAYMHYFSYTYESNFGRPTNSECIALIADSIKLNY